MKMFLSQTKKKNILTFFVRDDATTKRNESIKENVKMWEKYGKWNENEMADQQNKKILWTNKHRHYYIKRPDILFGTNSVKL